MRRRFQLICAAGLIGWLAYLAIPTREGAAPMPASTEAANEGEVVSEEMAQAEKAAYERDARTQLEQLASLDAKLRKRNLAASRTYEVRSQLQLAKYSLWLEVIQTNQSDYQVLRRRVQESPNGEARCTICDGTGWRSFCLLCQDRGQCPTCRGSGQDGPEASCPTCQGSGKCYLCAGGKRMACQFCITGIISGKVPPPPARLPLFCDAPPPPESLPAHLEEAQASAQAEAARQARESARTPTPTPGHSAAVSAAVWSGATLLTLVILALVFKRRFDSMLSTSDQAEERAKQLLAEDPSLAVFFSELRAGLNVPGAPAVGPLNGIQPSSEESAPATTPDELREFFASVPDQLAYLRKQLSDFRRAADPADQQNILQEFLSQVSGLKELAQPQELRPVWLTAFALEGLLKQLSRDATEVTDSVLRTIAGAVDLLEALCVRDLNPNLATEPPVHLLAVDDDPISRLAISFALKKAFDTPDLAPHAEAALALLEQKTYDVIFLDVDMPGMDGFELCTKIRQTTRHRTTPVVFVTRFSDFNSRAKSTLSGGESLIAKPFLPFEITVKALTLALRGRLQNSTAKSKSADATATSSTSIGAPAATTPWRPAPAAEPSAASAERRPEPESQSGSETASIPDDFRFADLIDASEAGSPEALFNRAPAYLEQLQNQLRAAQRARQPADLEKFVGRLCLGIRPFNAAAGQAGLRAAAGLGSALEGMLKKLQKHPQHCSPSALHAAGAALSLLAALCSRAATKLDLTRSTAHILVVDDDPIARRAISGSVQLVFGRPDNAEHGHAALALATEKPFDLIFLDVLMPDMDGFATCKRIHQTVLNRHTPVVFVTSLDTAEAQAQAMVAGGCGLISKPVLASQITLTAFTYILRDRFDKLESRALTEAACLVAA